MVTSIIRRANHSSVNNRQHNSRQEARSVAAVVCAHNEQDGLAEVLQVLTSYKGFSEVIVVDDGSTDLTSEIAAQFKVKVIRHATNRGKGAAMTTGVRAATAEVIFFADADVKGLTHRMISRTIAPVLSGRREMMIAMRHRAIYVLPLVLSLTPHLGGERAITRRLWRRVPATFKTGFKIEAGLNYFAERYGGGFGYWSAVGLSQVIKEKKRGWMRGLAARIEMCHQVAAAYLNVSLLALFRPAPAVSH